MHQIYAILATTALTAMIAVGTPASAANAIGPFTSTGPGAHSINQLNASTAAMTYNANGFGPYTWTMSGVATGSGTQTFAWKSTGFYSFFQVRAGLNAFSNAVVTPIYNYGPVNCCTAPSDGFSYSGIVQLNLVAGQTYGFNVRASNFDSARTNNGTLTIAAVPEPTSWAMLIAGFGLTGAAMRRRRTALAA